MQGKVHFLNNAKGKERVITPKTEKQIKVLTRWRR